MLIPNTADYKEWDVEAMLRWIGQLENGRLNKYIDVLSNGFIGSGISGEDLPELTRNDLSSYPFEIGHFRDKKQLEMHFKSLSSGAGGMDENEGVATAFIG